MCVLSPPTFSISLSVSLSVSLSLSLCLSLSLSLSIRQAVVDVQNGGKQTFEPNVMTKTADEGRNLVATLALYHLTLAQQTQIETRLPPCYRAWWKQRQDDDDTLQRAERDDANAERNAFVQGLLSQHKDGAFSLPSQSVNGDDFVDDDVSKRAMTDQVPRPSATLSPSSIFALRESLHPQQSIVDGQHSLPVHTFKEDILDRIASHQV
jgi:hypothetical protein